MRTVGKHGLAGMVRLQSQTNGVLFQNPIGDKSRCFPIVVPERATKPLPALDRSSVIRRRHKNQPIVQPLAIPFRGIIVAAPIDILGEDRIDILEVPGVDEAVIVKKALGGVVESVLHATRRADRGHRQRATTAGAARVRVSDSGGGLCPLAAYTWPCSRSSHPAIISTKNLSQ